MEPQRAVVHTRNGKLSVLTRPFARLPRRALTDFRGNRVDFTANVRRILEVESITSRLSRRPLAIFRVRSPRRNTTLTHSFDTLSDINRQSSANTASGDWDLASRPSISSLGQSYYIVISPPEPEDNKQAQPNSRSLRSSIDHEARALNHRFIMENLEIFTRRAKARNHLGGNSLTSHEDVVVTNSQQGVQLLPQRHVYTTEQLFALRPTETIVPSQLNFHAGAPLEQILRNPVATPEVVSKSLENKSESQETNEPQGNQAAMVAQDVVEESGGVHASVSDDEQEVVVFRSGVHVRGGAIARGQNGSALRNSTFVHPSIIRLPRAPPIGLSAQEEQGFTRFKDVHASPSHVRVTAGGLIVPADKDHGMRFVLADGREQWINVRKQFNETRAAYLRELAEEAAKAGREKNKPGESATAGASATNVNDPFINSTPPITVGADSTTQTHNQGQAALTQSVISEPSQLPRELKLVSEDGAPIIQIGGSMFREVTRGSEKVYELLPQMQPLGFNPFVNMIGHQMQQQHMVPTTAAGHQSLVPLLANSFLQPVTNMQHMAQMHHIDPMQQMSAIHQMMPMQPTASMHMMAPPYINTMPSAIPQQQVYEQGHIMGSYFPAVQQGSQDFSHPTAEGNAQLDVGIANVQPAAYLCGQSAVKLQLLNLQNQLNMTKAQQTVIEEQWALHETSWTSNEKKANRAQYRDLVNHRDQLRRQLTQIQAMASGPSSQQPRKKEDRTSNILSPNAPAFVPRGLSIEIPERVQVRRQDQALQKAFSDRTRVGPPVKQDALMAQVNWHEVIFASSAVSVDETDIEYCTKMGWNDPAAPKQYCTTAREVEWVIKNVRMHAQKFGCKNGSSKDPAFDAEEDLRHAMHTRRPIPLAPMTPEFVQTVSPWDWEVSIFNVCRASVGWVPNSFSRIGAPIQVEAQIDVWDDARLETLEVKFKGQSNASRSRREVSFASSRKRNGSEVSWNSDWASPVIKPIELTGNSRDVSKKQRRQLRINAREAHDKFVPSTQAVAGDQRHGLAGPSIKHLINDESAKEAKVSLQERRLPSLTIDGKPITNSGPLSVIIKKTPEEMFWAGERDPELHARIEAICAEPWRRLPGESVADFRRNHFLGMSMFEKNKAQWEKDNNMKSDKVFPPMASDDLTEAEFLESQNKENRHPVQARHAAGNPLEKTSASLASFNVEAHGTVPAGPSASAYISSNPYLSSQQPQRTGSNSVHHQASRGPHGPNALPNQPEQSIGFFGNHHPSFLNRVAATSASRILQREQKTRIQDARPQDFGEESRSSAFRAPQEQTARTQDARPQEFGESSRMGALRMQREQTTLSQDVRLQDFGGVSRTSTFRNPREQMTQSQDVRLQGFTETSRTSTFRNQREQSINFHDARLQPAQPIGSRGAHQQGVGEASGLSASNFPGPFDAPDPQTRHPMLFTTPTRRRRSHRPHPDERNFGGALLRYPSDSMNGQPFHFSQPRGW